MGNRQFGRVDGGQPFLANDHMSVPIVDHVPPAANRGGPLDPLISVLQTYPRVLLVIVILLAVLLIFAIVMIALIAQTRNECDRADNGGGDSSVSCGWNGKDLSALSYDLTFSYNINKYYLRPCGRVSNSDCSNLFDGQSQACTYQANNNVVWDNGDWEGNNGVEGAWSTYGAGGLQYHTSNGGSCGSGSRSLYVFYSCESGSNGYISAVVELESACVTHYFVNTQFVC